MPVERPNVASFGLKTMFFASHILEARTEYFSIVAQGYTNLLKFNRSTLLIAASFRLAAFLRTLIYFIAADGVACAILSESAHDNEKTPQKSKVYH